MPLSPAIQTLLARGGPAADLIVHHALTVTRLRLTDKAAVPAALAAARRALSGVPELSALDDVDLRMTFRLVAEWCVARSG